MRQAAYFLSDLHLGARYFSDRLSVEKRIVRFLKSIEDDCAELYLVGDILDYWFEYKSAVPRGFVRFFGQLAHMADAGVKITWLIGNHDIWIFDYLPTELGIEVVDGVIEREVCGRNFIITHGDGVGKISFSFRFIRGMFRNKVCQKLYSMLHPGLTIPFAYGWSNSNRCGHPVPLPYAGEQEPLIVYAREYLSGHPAVNYFVFGHRHILVNEQLSSTCHAVILGDWIDLCSYARIAPGEELTLHTFSE